MRTNHVAILYTITSVGCFAPNLKFNALRGKAMVTISLGMSVKKEWFYNEFHSPLCEKPDDNSEYFTSEK